MARNDKVPFRREVELLTSGYVMSEDGFFVGDIMSLHVNTGNDKDVVFVQGKSSVKSSWENIYSGTEDLGIDIRAWEHVRVHVTLGNGTSRVVLFGYELPVDKEIQTVRLLGTDNDDVVNSRMLLEDILVQLKINNLHQSIITGAMFDSEDIED